MTTKSAIMDAVSRNGGSKTAAAKDLGIARSTLYRALGPQVSHSEVDVVISDIHRPFECPIALGLAMSFIGRLRPTRVHLLGDICDFYSISRFDKDPARKETLWDEIQSVKEFLGQLREIAPDSQILYSEGNHENRLQRYLRSRAPELESLPALQLDSLLGLKEFEISWHRQERPYKIGHLMFLHGTLVRKHAGYSARGHFEKWGCTLIHGHVHRMGRYAVRVNGDSYGAWENPCLCDVDPCYDPCPNWQQGWSVICYGANDRFSVEQVEVIRGQYCWRGDVFGEETEGVI